jgi:hypothetical protein
MKKLRLDTLWKRARAWAEATGREHNYSVVQDAAPL